MAVEIKPEARAHFESMGLEVVRRDLGLGFSIPDRMQHQAIAWCAEQDRAAAASKRRYDRWVLILAAIAALTGTIGMAAGVVAAVPVVRDWISPPKKATSRKVTAPRSPEAARAASSR